MVAVPAGYFPESALAHRLLDGLYGIEIGGSAHNAFNVSGCLNVDYTDSLDTEFKREEVRLCGRALPVDIVADGADLPFADETFDYVISSHQLEHAWDPIATIKEWVRVLRTAGPRGDCWHGQPTPIGGYIFLVVPHRLRQSADREADARVDRTSLDILIARNRGSLPPPQDYVAKNFYAHRCFWDEASWTDELIPYLCKEYHLELAAFLAIDDKVGNGMTIVFKKVG